MDDILPRIDRNALSFWFPFLQRAGLPVPRTRTFAMPEEAKAVIPDRFDGRRGKDGGKALTGFAAHIASEVRRDFGFPFFLRTDHTSGKHEWSRTCYVGSAGDLAAHMVVIAEYSEIVDMIGLPWETWVARELLPTAPIGTCPLYRDMPICREFRAFVGGGKVVCVHPYWPREALEKGGARLSPRDYHKLSTLRDVGELEQVRDLAARAGAAIGGAWSVDILDTARGWCITDMAEAERSWHWPDCAQRERMARAIWPC